MNKFIPEFQLKKVVLSINEPPDKNVIWLFQSGEGFDLKIYNNGWVTLLNFNIITKNILYSIPLNLSEVLKQISRNNIEASLRLSVKYVDFISDTEPITPNIDVYWYNLNDYTYYVSTMYNNQLLFMPITFTNDVDYFLMTNDFKILYLISDSVYKIFDTTKDGQPKFPDGTITSTAIGDLLVGTDISKLTALEVLDLAINQEKYPTLTTPSYSFTLNPSSNVQEVNSTVVYGLNDNFNRGLISPDYPLLTAGPRTGIATGFTGFTPQSVIITLGANTFVRSVQYAEGKVPLTSKGRIAGAAYPSGSITNSVTVYGVYPTYATTINLHTFTKQPLLMHGTTLSYTLVAGQAAVLIPTLWYTNWALVRIQLFDTNANIFKDIDKNSFDVDDITINGIDYKLFTSTEILGTRIIRFIL